MTFLRNDLWCHRSLRQSEREKEEVITNAWWIASHVWRAHLFPRRFYPLQTCRPFSPLSLWVSYFHLSRDVMMSPIFVDRHKDLLCISELGQSYQKSRNIKFLLQVSKNAQSIYGSKEKYFAVITIFIFAVFKLRLWELRCPLSTISSRLQFRQTHVNKRSWLSTRVLKRPSVWIRCTTFTWRVTCVVNWSSDKYTIEY